jgi:hypothetical protein
MSQPSGPPIAVELLKRIRLVRRDIGNLLFHFTRAPESDRIVVHLPRGGSLHMPGTASAVLRKILMDGYLLGSSGWTYGFETICFTEAPIQEFNSVFSLVEIAASRDERPRYEPYGIAVPKDFLFGQGGRPVIYDHPDVLDGLPEDMKYRFVPYDPASDLDFTWEREWRIRTDRLQLDPKQTLVVVPTAEEAFEFAYEFAEMQADWDVEGSGGEAYISGFYHEARWLAVSLDLFGFRR